MSTNLIEKFSLGFIKEIISQGGKPYLVGGCVRDTYLNIKPKDFDFLICKLSFDKLKEILNNYGEVDLVGESFGILIFKCKEDKSTYEIALPRKDYLDKEKRGHKAIITQSDPNLSVEEDLKRRDFTINAMAFSHEGKLIDPFNGLNDINLQVINAVSKETFVEDPLRMLRAIYFASTLFKEKCEVNEKNTLDK